MRRLTVCKGRGFIIEDSDKQEIASKLYLHGRWMYDAGFRPGHIVEVTVEEQHIRLKVVGEITAFSVCREHLFRWYDNRA